ncbi:MAG: hypothetical protein ABI443_07475 [Chthoniobacterales bacterium]
MGGYISIAAGDTYFRESLLSAITSLGYTPVEMISRIRIKETTEEFQIAVQGWIGTAQLKPVSKYSAPTLKKIVRNMNRYFRNSRGKMNYTLSYFYLIFGFLMLFLCLALLSMDLSVAADK